MSDEFSDKKDSYCESDDSFTCFLRSDTPCLLDVHHSFEQNSPKNYGNKHCPSVKEGLLKRPKKAFMDRTITLFPKSYQRVQCPKLIGSPSQDSVFKRSLGEKFGASYHLYAYAFDRRKTALQDMSDPREGEELKQFGLRHSTEENFPVGQYNKICKFDHGSNFFKKIPTAKVPRVIRSTFNKFEELSAFSGAQCMLVMQEKQKKHHIYMWSSLHRKEIPAQPVATYTPKKSKVDEWFHDDEVSQASTMSRSSSSFLSSSFQGRRASSKECELKKSTVSSFTDLPSEPSRLFSSRHECGDCTFFKSELNSRRRSLNSQLDAFSEAQNEETFAFSLMSLKPVIPSRRNASSIKQKPALILKELGQDFESTQESEQPKIDNLLSLSEPNHREIGTSNRKVSFCFKESLFSQAEILLKSPRIEENKLANWATDFNDEKSQGSLGKRYKETDACLDLKRLSFICSGQKNREMETRLNNLLNQLEMCPEEKADQINEFFDEHKWGCSDIKTSPFDMDFDPDFSNLS